MKVTAPGRVSGVGGTLQLSWQIVSMSFARPMDQGWQLISISQKAPYQKSFLKGMPKEPAGCGTGFLEFYSPLNKHRDNNVDAIV